MGDKENIDVPGRKRYSAKKEKFDKIVKQSTGQGRKIMSKEKEN